MKKYVIDTSALVAFFNDEPGADVVEGLLNDTSSGVCAITMNKYNLLEAYYGYFRANGEAFAERILRAVDESSVKVADVLTDELLRKAGRMKVQHRMSLADAMLVAQALVDNAIVITADHHELDDLDEKDVVKFLWIR